MEATMLTCIWQYRTIWYYTPPRSHFHHRSPIWIPTRAQSIRQNYQTICSQNTPHHQHIFSDWSPPIIPWPDHGRCHQHLSQKIYLKSIPESAHYNGFTLSILAQLLLQWTALGQLLIKDSFIHRLIPTPFKELAITLIPKSVSIDRRSIFLMDDTKTFLTMYIEQYLFHYFEHTDNLPYYINANCKENHSTTLPPHIS